jgi:hypothetical protein
MLKASEEDIEASISHGYKELVERCLKTTVHRNHASTFNLWRNNIDGADFGLVSRRPDEESLESPHNNIHVACGGIMKTMISSFHPIFWMHHCNVDRIYEKYIELEPDSQREFARFQSLAGDRITPQAGFPDGVYGPLMPFINHTTGEAFHAKDSFDCRALGFVYDVLPEAPQSDAMQMREPPYFAAFKGVDVNKMEKESRMLFVYLADSTSNVQWVPPVKHTRKALTSHPGYAGNAGIFFLAIEAGCANCEASVPFDIFVDLTSALRAANIHPQNVALHVLVENEDGAVVPLSDTPVPVPVLLGPTFNSMSTVIGSSTPADSSATSAAASDPNDVRHLQTILNATGCIGAILLEEDGECGPLTTHARCSFCNMIGVARGCY